MAERPRFFDDLAGVAGGAFSALSGLRDEAESTIRARVDEAIRRFDLVKREDLEAVQDMAAAARRMETGDYSVRVHTRSRDEVGKLATAFDRMRGELEHLEQSRRDLVANVSHELKTPITAIRAHLENLLDGVEQPEPATLGVMLSQVERLGRLVDQLLDLSRLESGALELRPEPTDVNQLAREVAGEFTPAAQRHESAVRLELPDHPIELDCDPERVAQVLRILLDNALVHTPTGTGVRVSAARANGHVRLEVSDRGLGIKRQNMPHIFEPFFTSNDEAQGAGLGLAIARELAERMHGELTVRSVPGRTTFSLELPS